MIKHRRGVAFFVIIMIVLLVLPFSTNLAHAAPPSQTDSVIAQPFERYYWRYDGPRILGYVQSYLLDINGYQSQYFEKGRIEDHSHEVSDPTWALMYGRLTVELMEYAWWVPVNNTTITYGDLWGYTEQRFGVPEGFSTGTMPVEGGVFVPFDAQLGAVPGYVIPDYFWAYINRADLFPGGWLHNIGLPLTNGFLIETYKGGEPRTIVMQAFERTVLTYDVQNPPEWQIERGNIGTDALLSIGMTPLQIQPTRPTGPKRIEISLDRQWLYAFEGDIQVFDAPVSTGKNGFETPRGSFAVYTKLIKQDMRGSARGETWDVRNVPHVMYFRQGGYAIHGTYWHNTFGTGARLSHGCVNLPLDKAAWLYDWTPIGTPVIVY